jgi:hypothetical protein
MKCMHATFKRKAYVHLSAYKTSPVYDTTVFLILTAEMES